MKHFFPWIRFLTVYILKKKLFWCILAAMAVISAGAALTSGQHQIIRVALYCQSPDEMTQTVLQQLEVSEDGLYRFYRTNSLTYLKEDVASHKAECGYILPDGLEALLQEDAQRIITVYTSPSTILSSIIDETVYNAIFREYAKTMLTDYIEEHGLLDLDREGLETAVAEQYAYESQNTLTFHVVYEDVPEDFYDDQSLFHISVRGLLALLMVVTALGGASQYRHDLVHGCFLLRRPGEWIYVPLLYSLLPCLFLAGTGLLCLLLSGDSAIVSSASFVSAPIHNIALRELWGAALELLLLTAYAFCVSLAAWFLGRCISGSLALDALIPILILFCLLYSPALMDLSTSLPGTELLSWLAPSSWYLKAAESLSLIH